MDTASPALLRTDTGPRLRIVLVAPPYFQIPPTGYGGIEAMLADLADGLVDQGHDVTVLAAGLPGTKARFRAVWDQTVPERLGEPGAEIIYGAATRLAVAEMISTGRVDVVHDHTFAGPLNAPYYRMLGVPTAVTVHGPVHSELGDLYEALGSEVSLIAISDRQRAIAPHLNWVGTVHNGLRIDDWPFEPVKGDYALFMGRFSADKGAHLALDAARAAGLPLVLAGKCAEPPEREYFAREVAPRMGPDDRYVGIANAADKRRLLARARCLLFPIQWEEPFGMVMIEAMACGTPVVALRAGAVPEVLVDGVTGLILDRPDQLPAALARVRSLDPARCRRHVEEHFSAAGMATGYVAAYRETIVRSRLRVGEPTVPARARARFRANVPLVPALSGKRPNGARWSAVDDGVSNGVAAG